MKLTGTVTRTVAALLTVCLCLSILQGCYVAPVSLTDSTVPVDPGSYTELGEAHGTAYAISAFGIPLSEPDPAGRARDRAIESAQADGLVNVSCENQIFNLMVVPVVIYTTRVHGTAIKVNS